MRKLVSALITLAIFICPAKNAFGNPMRPKIKVRKTARIVLLDQDDRVLLMNIRVSGVYDPVKKLQKSFWVTIGGKIEEGESLSEAVMRECREETGLTDIKIVRPIWHGTVVLNWDGVLTELDETFVLARAQSTEISTKEFTEGEKEVFEKYKWWSLPELGQTSETIIPKDLFNLLKDLRQNPAHAIIEIDLSTPDSKD